MISFLFTSLSGSLLHPWSTAAFSRSSDWGDLHPEDTTQLYDYILISSADQLHHYHKVLLETIVINSKLNIKIIPQ